MTHEEEAEEFATKIIDTMGAAEALLMAMRLTLMVGQRAGADPAIAAAVQDSIAAIKRVGALTGSFTLPS